jgi:hypothetical protein
MFVFFPPNYSADISYNQNHIRFYSNFRGSNSSSIFSICFQVFHFIIIHANQSSFFAGYLHRLTFVF